MSLVLYNTLTRKKEVFKSIREGEVSLYTCGPTVYNYLHIGNLRTFLFEDILVRYLRQKGYKVKQIMNITDVDDKTIRGANSLGVSLLEYTARFKKAFFEDIEALFITKAYKYPCATDHTDYMVSLIEKLLEGGLAYRSSDGSIYFSIDKFRDYGKLSSIEKRQLKIGASGRVSSDEYSKDNVNDFVLWKAYSKEDGDVFWDTAIGKGRPGWHIECSAMSMYYLGDSFDIHTGGVDNIFPHHENEIAQSEGVTGKRFVNFWMHSEFLNIKGEKSSKSKGNVVYLKDLINKGHSKEAIRYSLISSHYRTKINYSEDLIKQAELSISSINSFIERIKQISKDKDLNKSLLKIIKEKEAKCEVSMDDDLNMPSFLASIFELIKEVNRIIDDLGRHDAKRILLFLRGVNRILDVLDIDTDMLLDDDIKKLISERELKRKNKDYRGADAIRDRLKEQGIMIDDTQNGVVWHRKKRQGAF